MSIGPLTLAIEVSNPSADLAPGMHGGDAPGPGVALARGGDVFAQRALGSADGRHDDDLMPSIDRLVREAALEPRNLERIAVSIGPGGFTGVRVAIATAKALGEILLAHRPGSACCVPVHSAEVAARGVVDRGGARCPLLVALASKRQTAHITPIGPDGRAALPGLVIDAAGLGAVLERYPCAVLLADRFLPEPMRQEAARLGLEVRPPVFSAAACARAAAAIDPVDPGDLLPLYPREPEAVTTWRALHPGG